MTALADYTLPTTEEEVWRYSRIDELDLEAYTPADAAVATAIPPVIEAALSRGRSGAGVTVIVVNGRIIHLDVQAPGVDIITDDRDALGAAMTEPTDVFAAMNDALTTEPIVVGR